MMYSIKELAQKYYQFWLGFTNLKNKVRIWPVNFQEPWPTIIKSQKKFVIIALIGNTFTHVFYTLVPLLMGNIIQTKNTSTFLYFICFWLAALISEYLTLYAMSLLEIQCINSIQYNAFQFFLTVDPLYHATKSTGKLFAKIERGARSYEDFLDLLLLDLSPTIISVTTVIISFMFADITLGIVSLFLLAFIALLNITLNLFTGLAFEKNLIEADDSVKSISVESLTQVQLIRASFAANEIASNVKQKNTALMVKEGSGWLAFSTTNFLTRLTYVISIFILGSLILNRVIHNELSIVAATALILTYLRGTSEIIQVGRRLRKLIKAVIRIKDLYSFIRNFGYETYPVLPKRGTHPDIEENLDDPEIILQAQDLHFDYNQKAKIFDNHNLLLQVPHKQKNKLYGIIGPSGMGKTTLLSILGGQLNPDKGSVTINNISIYSVDDTIRRKLIAIQGQTATSMSGSVKSNLLLGLPKSPKPYSDNQIIDVLHEVGLWHIFKEKDGLNTSIGEGGFTLSGGQRQRLNFASLYLRANYYKPLVILIDEPTSSLDEVSEKAITTMISDLATQALTIVIAHRLKTIQNAQGILDFSLLDREKEINFYTKKELEVHSLYYRKLIDGDIIFDS